MKYKDPFLNFTHMATFQFLNNSAYKCIHTYCRKYAKYKNKEENNPQIQEP